MTVSTSELYDRASSQWRRTEPLLLSDFTARPFLLEWCSPAEGKCVLDLGCGEGYVARQLAQRGARRVEGIDISAEMIGLAQQREAEEQLGIRYRVGHAAERSPFADASFDLVVAVFLFNYLDTADTLATMREVRRLLVPGGTFVFAVPHPSLPFLRQPEPPFYFSRGGIGYFSGRNHQLEGKIWRRDGSAVPVRCVHKTLTDYFTALRGAGFTRMPDVHELHATDAHQQLDPGFFGPLEDEPLHLAFRVSTEGGR